MLRDTGTRGGPVPRASREPSEADLTEGLRGMWVGVAAVTTRAWSANRVARPSVGGTLCERAPELARTARGKSGGVRE